MNSAVLKKKENASLRPLSEKEIQKKLYGSYYESSAEAVEEKIVPAPAPSKNKPVVASPAFKTPKREVRVELPKPALRIPWAEIENILVRVLKTGWNILKMLLDRIPAPWGAGILIVLFLFFGIHSLNVYRTNAMKQARPRSARVAAPAPLPPLPVAPNVQEAEKSVETPLRPAIEEPVPPREKSTPPAVPKKSFVVQVATYARKEDAQVKADEIKRQNFPAFTQPLSRGNQKNFHAVFLGRFETFKEAQAKLGEFRQNPVGRGFDDSFVRSL